MGLGIVVLLIGIPLSFLMWFKPRKLWRATESWKFRNPDANEPSDSTSTGSPYPSRSSTTLPLPPPTAFMPPSVITRGSLPMIGYLTSPQPDGGLIATIYFWAPEVASKIPAGNPPPPAPCELGPNVQGAGTDHVTVDVNLICRRHRCPGCQ
jgi:hypothetical protein